MRNLLLLLTVSSTLLAMEGGKPNPEVQNIQDEIQQQIDSIKKLHSELEKLQRIANSLNGHELSEEDSAEFTKDLGNKLTPIAMERQKITQKREELLQRLKKAREPFED